MQPRFPCQTAVAAPLLACVLGWTLGAALCPAPGSATTLADLQAQGYRTRLDSAIPGRFTGCLKAVAWTLTDGSVFICQAAWRADLRHPRALLLERDVEPGAEPDSMLLIAGHAYAASLTRLAGRKLGAPWPLRADQEAPAREPSGQTQAEPIAAIGVLQAIDRLHDQDHPRLNDAQPARLQTKPNSGR